MTVIKVTCPTCGDQDLQVWQILVRRCGGVLAYEFTCGGCDEDVEHGTDAATVERLQRAGVRVVDVAAALTAADIAAATRYLRAHDHLVADILAMPSEDTA